MGTQAMVLLVAIVYLILMLGVGAWVNMRMKSSKEFLIAWQPLKFFVIAIAAFSAIQRGWGVVGYPVTTSDGGTGSLS